MYILVKNTCILRENALPLRNKGCKREVSLKKRIINIIFLIMVVGLASAQVRRPKAHRDTRHYFYSNTTAAYSILLDGYNNTNEHGGFACILGLGYSFRVPNFWFEVGAELQELSSYMQLIDDISDMRVKDTEGDIAIYHYNKDYWYDRQDLLYVGVPVMLGYHHYKGFSVGAGLKYSLRLYGVSHNRLTYSTSATYSNYIEDFEGMDNHDYSDYNRYVREQITDKMNHKWSACFEIGYTIYNNHNNYTSIKNRHVVCRLTGFLEYGLNSLITNYDKRNMYSINPNNPAELNTVSFYRATPTQSSFSIPLVIGVRWTYTLATITCRTCR